jgi:hypothetical protein
MTDPGDHSEVTFKPITDQTGVRIASFYDFIQVLIPLEIALHSLPEKWGLKLSQIGRNKVNSPSIYP